MKRDYSYSSEFQVRLTQYDIEAIQKCFKQVFGVDSHLWLFGSRTDLNKRGGDIDLYIETDLSPGEAFEKKIKFTSLLLQNIEEQKVDVVIHNTKDSPLLVHSEARRTGVKLI